MIDWQSLFSKIQIPLHQDGFSAVLSEQTCIIPRVNHAQLQVSGPDTQKFLQGQCTCDLNRLESVEFLLGAHCTHKGRMNSSFVIAPLASGAMGLQVHSGIIDHALASLKKYIVFSKAEIAVADNMGSVYLTGPDAENILRELGLTAPSPGKFYQSDQITVLQHAQHQFEIWSREETLLGLCQSAPVLTAENYVDLLNIRRGIGEVRAETIEEFIPQDLNFQLTGGVSFSKGCYTGQEIIARMHYKGKIKKHMYRGVADAGNPPAPATPIVDGADKNVGKIVFAAHNENRQAVFLALVNDDATEGETFSSGPDSRAKISWQPLPYAIPK